MKGKPRGRPRGQPRKSKEEQTLESRIEAAILLGVESLDSIAKREGVPIALVDAIASSLENAGKKPIRKIVGNEMIRERNKAMAEGLPQELAEAAISDEISRQAELMQKMVRNAIYLADAMPAIIAGVENAAEIKDLAIAHRHLMDAHKLTGSAEPSEMVIRVTNAPDI